MNDPVRRPRAGVDARRCCANRNAARAYFAPFTLHLVAPVAAKAREVIVEGFELAILPMVLNPHARKEANLFERLTLIGKTKIHMDGGNLIIGGNFAERLPHELD